jgi:hypothetical protein
MAIGPVILISGVGLLMLSMTNRLGRVVDRSRALAESLRRSPEPEHDRFRSQLRILAIRSRLLRLAITLASLSVLLAAVLVIGIFFSALLHLEVGFLIILLFVGCLLCLIGSLIVFIRDLYVSLVALELETDVKL